VDVAERVGVDPVVLRVVHFEAEIGWDTAAS
jgi:hypothetical protein